MNAVLSDAIATSPSCHECVGRDNCFFKQLPDAVHERIRPMLRERSFSPGDVLQQQGVLIPVLQVVKVGDLLCKSQPPVGEEHAVALIGQGQLIGMTNVWQMPSSVTVQALSSGRVCQADIRQMQQGNLFTPEVLLMLGQSKIKAMQRLTDWAMAARQKTVHERGCCVCSPRCNALHRCACRRMQSWLALWAVRARRWCGHCASWKMLAAFCAVRVGCMNSTSTCAVFARRIAPPAITYSFYILWVTFVTKPQYSPPHWAENLSLFDTCTCKMAQA